MTFRNFGPECPEHRFLLDLPVRTDTNWRKVYFETPLVGVGRGLKGDLTVPIRCESCGLPIAKCSCIAGIDY